jgi:hypothetical protein
LAKSRAPMVCRTRLDPPEPAGGTSRARKIAYGAGGRRWQPRELAFDEVQYVQDLSKIVSGSVGFDGG